jgi:hypothetical protein
MGMFSKKEPQMSFVVVPNATANFSPRKGLEGPFNFSGRVLYYDNKEGSYYDPLTDFYVGQDEMDAINQAFYERFKK